MRSWDTLHPRQATSGREGGGEGWWRQRGKEEGKRGGGQRKEGGEWEGSGRGEGQNYSGYALSTGNTSTFTSNMEDWKVFPFQRQTNIKISLCVCVWGGGGGLIDGSGCPRTFAFLNALV